MAELILVVSKPHGRLEQLLPSIEKVAQPGMRVVFLFPYPVEGWAAWRAGFGTMETGTRTMWLSTAQKMAERYSLEEQRRLGAAKVSRVDTILRNRGVDVSVEVYHGSLRKVVKEYTRHEDVYLIFQPGPGLPLRRFLHGATLSDLLRRPRFAPLLLHHADHGV